MWPLLLRELRLEARRPSNRWLRVGSAVVFFLILIGALRKPVPLHQLCRTLFPILHGMLLALPWCVAPTLVAEVISRERRTGMLEQLQLTRVTWGAIVRAITAVITARTITLMLAAFPVVMITVLFGGVGIAELRMSALMQCLSLIQALSVALLAGALGRSWATSLLWAAALGVVWGGGASWAVFTKFHGSVALPYAPAVWSMPETAAGYGVEWIRFLMNRGSIWSPTFAVLPVRVVDRWWDYLHAVIGLTLGLHLVVGFVAAIVLRRGMSVSANRPTTRETAFALPGLPGSVAPEVRREWLRGNPVRWLMRYPGEVRWIRVTAAGAMLCLEIGVFALRLSFDAWFLVQTLLLGLLSTSLAFIAADSYRRERENGAFEMLMVTPLRPRDLGRGRIGGLWWMLGPAYLVWSASIWLGVPILRTGEDHLALFLWGLALVASIPVVGLEAAFQFRGCWRSALATLGLTCGLSGGLFWMGVAEDAVFWVTPLALLILGVVTALNFPGFEQRFSRNRNGETPRSRRLHPEPVDSPYTRVIRERGPRPLPKIPHS